MDVLNILDVNSILYTAENVKDLASSVSRGCPVGGMKLLLRKISYYLSVGESVICAFDSPTDRKSIFPEYKKGRPGNDKVKLQNDILIKVLREAGICCLKENNFEADDLIFSAVEKCKKDFSQVRIHSTDKDLCHNIDYGKVSLFTVNSTTCNVNFNTFSSILKIPFNTITPYKVLCGDSSDSIGTFVSESGIPSKKIFDNFVDVLANKTQYSPELWRHRVLLEKLGPFAGLTQNDMIEIKKRCDLFYPRLSQKEIVPSNLRTINHKYYYGLVNAIGDYDSCKSLKCKGQEVEELNQLIYDYGKSYSRGEYHVDNNLSLDTDLTIDTSNVIIRGL